MKILAISGSARSESANTAFLKGIKELAPSGVEFNIFHRLDILPVFSPDSEGKKTPSEVIQFLQLVATADGIIISSPEYIRSIPGGLKNAIDWMVSRFEIIGKPIALAHASHRGDGMLVSLRRVLSTVSDRFLENLFVRVPVIGKSQEEILSLMRQPEQKTQVSSFLSQFLSEIHQKRKHEAVA